MVWRRSRFRRRSFRRKPRYKGFRRYKRRRFFKRRSFRRRRAKISTFWARVFYGAHSMPNNTSEPIVYDQFYTSLQDFSTARPYIASNFNHYKIVKMVVRIKVFGGPLSAGEVGPMKTSPTAAPAIMTPGLDCPRWITCIDSDGTPPTTVSGMKTEPTYKAVRVVPGRTYSRSCAPIFLTDVYAGVASTTYRAQRGWINTDYNTVRHWGISSAMNCGGYDNWASTFFGREIWVKVAFKGKKIVRMGKDLEQN